MLYIYSSSVSMVIFSTTFWYASVKLKIVCLDLVSEQTVTAGKGICHTGVDFSAKLTITGLLFHLSHMLSVSDVHA